jgi:hypothetical protein
MIDERLQTLLDRYRDGSLSEEDRAELERQLLSSAQAREQYWAHARLHGLLSRWGQESWGRDLIDQPARSATPVEVPPDPIEFSSSSADFSDVDSPEAAVVDEDGRPTRPPVALGDTEGDADGYWPQPQPRIVGWTAKRLGLLALAAAVMVASVIVFQFASRQPNKPIYGTPTTAPQTLPAGVAILSSAAQATWASPADAVNVGDVLLPGMLKLTGGAVQIDFYSGARIVLQGPAELELRGENEAFCQSGRLSAHVPEPARGFKVGAPGMTVVDLGTEFALAVPSDKPPEVHVFRGLVEVLPAENPRTLKLKAGEAARVEPAGIATLKADRSRFLGEADFHRLSSTSAELRYSAWQEASRRFSADPGMLVYYAPGGRSTAYRSVVNLAQASPLAQYAASIVGCDSAEGRWPNTQSLHFAGRGDRLRVDVPLTFKSFTLMAWVRIDALPAALHGLLIPDGQSEGTVRWEIDSDGRMRLGIARASGRPDPNWEVVISPPAITPDRTGRWLMLVTTYDGKTIRHYVDGEMVKTGQAFSPAPLRIGPADVGNWRGNADRHLHGRLDEIAVLIRDLTDDEIRQLYAAGRPEAPPPKP